MSLSIHPLDLGDLELDASFVNWQTGCGTKSWFPTTGWLILGSERPILVDTSFRSVEDALSNQWLTARRSPQQTLEFQLGKHGLGLTDIGYCPVASSIISTTPSTFRSAGFRAPTSMPRRRAIDVFAKMSKKIASLPSDYTTPIAAPKSRRVQG